MTQRGLDRSKFHPAHASILIGQTGRKKSSLLSPFTRGWPSGLGASLQAGHASSNPAPRSYSAPNVPDDRPPVLEELRTTTRGLDNTLVMWRYGHSTLSTESDCGNGGDSIEYKHTSHWT